MASVGNPSTPWPPYDSYRDCSKRICSIYCPQRCYIIFPPPPPSRDSESNSGTNFSPLIIAIIGIVASAFLLVSYYTIISKYCKRRSNQMNPTLESESNQNQTNHDQWQLATSGLDETVIKSIAICKYKKGDGLIEGTDCAVCLSEFQEEESLRLLPKCNHAFHLPCIDTWLRSHSNCPLCRSGINPIPIPPAPESQPSSNLNISSLEFQRGSDLVLVVEERERAAGHREEVVVSFVSNNELLLPKHPFSQFKSGNELELEGGNHIDMNNIGGIGEMGVEEFRRSSSMGSFSCQNNLLIADTLSIDEDYDQLGQGGIGSSNSNSRGENNNNCKPNRRINMRRSISTGRFMFTTSDKGKSTSILPN